MAHDVARSRREPGGNPCRSVALPEEGVVVHVRGWIGPRAESAGGVQAGMVQVETDLGDEGGVQESPGQVPSVVEGPEEDSNQPALGRGRARLPVQGEEQARRQTDDSRVVTARLHEAMEPAGRPEVDGVGMPVDADPVPRRDARLGRQRRGLMAGVLQRPSEFAQVPPRLQLQGVGREGLGEDRDPKGFHGSAPHRGPWEGTAQAGQEIGTRAKGYRLFLRPRVARLPSEVVRGLKRISNKASGYLSFGGGSTCGS